MLSKRKNQDKGLMSIISIFDDDEHWLKEYHTVMYIFIYFNSDCEKFASINKKCQIKINNFFYNNKIQ